MRDPHWLPATPNDGRYCPGRPLQTTVTPGDPFARNWKAGIRFVAVSWVRIPPSPPETSKAPIEGFSVGAFAKANGVKPALFGTNSEGAYPACNGNCVLYTDPGVTATSPPSAWSSKTRGSRKRCCTTGWPTRRSRCSRSSTTTPSWARRIVDLGPVPGTMEGRAHDSVTTNSRRRRSHSGSQSVSSAGGMGRAMKKPCAKSQPWARR